MPEKKPIDILYSEYLLNTISGEDLEDFLLRLNDKDELGKVEMMMEGTWGEMFLNIEQGTRNDELRSGGSLSTGGMEEFDNSTIRQFGNGGSSTGGIDVPELNEELGIGNEELGEYDNLTIRQFDNEESSTRGIVVPENEEVEVKVERTAKVISILKWVAAAAIIGFVVWGLWFVVGRPFDGAQGDSLRQAQTDKVHDVKAPEVNRAMITLSDGKVVYLDSAGIGELANVSGVEVMKMEDGKIVYREASSVNREMVYNTLTNPRGSKVIDITLSDGSRVWLNAGSSLRYPVVFGNDKREVEIIGEGYFEIAPLQLPPRGGGTLRSKVPFLVRSGEVVTEVLGTHFNVNAYEDEGEIRVTLLEGSVRVKKIGDRREEIEGVKIKPGQSALLVSSELSVVSGEDTEAVMAWKNGRFLFKESGIETVMRQVERWYDVEVVYEDKIDEKFNGGISRGVNASQLFKILEATGKVRIRIEGRKVFVRK